MAILYDTTSTGMDAADPTSLTWSHTTTTADNRVLIVATSAESDSSGHTAQTVSGITYGGVALTHIRSDYITDNGTELWYLTAPATGANNIVVTMTAVVDGLFGAAMTFSGVDQTNPIDNNAGTTTTGTSISQALTPNVPGAMLVNITHHYNSSAVLVPDANQTERFNTPTTGDNDQAGGTRHVTTATSYTTTWTSDISDGVTLSVASLKPMPLSNDWTVSSQIRADHTKVSGASDLTNFPVLIKDGNIPDSVYGGLNNSNYSLDLEASSSQYAYVADNSALSITGDISCEAWVKLESLDFTSGNLMAIAAKYDSTNNKRSYFFGFRGNGTTANLVCLYSQDGLSTSLMRFDTTSRTFSASDYGKWIHLAITVSVSTEVCAMYEMGASIAVTKVTDNNATSIYNSDSNFTIGSSSSTPANYFDGILNNVRVFSDVRTGAEILSNMYLTLTGTSNNLVGSWLSTANDYVDMAGTNDLTASGSPVFVSDTPIKGIDLRITTDSAGTTEIPYEIVSMDTTAKTAEVWAKIPTLTTATDTSLYLWSGNASAIAYTATAPFGSQAVWDTAYKVVSHFQDTSNDSTVNGQNGTNTNISYETSVLSKGIDLNGSSSKVVYGTNVTNLKTTTHSIEFWIRQSADDDGVVFGTYHYPGSGGIAGFMIAKESGEIAYYTYNNSNTTPNSYLGGTVTLPTDGTPTHVVIVAKPNSQKIYINGTLDVSGTDADNPTYSTSVVSQIGTRSFSGNEYYLDADLDEFRFNNSELTADWIATEYANQNDPSTFWVLSTAWTWGVDDTLSLSDAQVNKPGKIVADTASLSDSISNKPGKVVADTASLSDNITSMKGLGATINDTVSLSDSTTSFIILIRSVADTLSLSDATINGSGKYLSDTLSLSDQQSSSVGKVIVDTISLSDSVVSSVGKFISDTLSLDDAIAAYRGLIQTVADTLSLADSVTFRPGRQINDSVVVTDVPWVNRNTSLSSWSGATLPSVTWSQPTGNGTVWTDFRLEART